MLKTWGLANVGATLRLAVLAVAFFAVAFMSPAVAGKRVALVIGNSAYKSVSPLPNPVNDAAAIAKSLAKIGFNVTHLSDLNGSDLRRALQDFEDTAAGAEIAIVYYAGHGIELNGENYLIPVDAALLRDSHVEDETVPLSRVMRAIEGASSLNLVILDACRDNPFTQQMQRSSAQRSIGRGLARVEPSGRTLVAYAAKGGTTADDGDGEHSPFAEALLNHLETPGLEVTFLFRQVHDDVLAATAQQQEPFLYGSLGATPIYLVPPGETPTTETPPPAVDATPPSSSASGNALMEADYLAALRTNTEEAYRAFQEKHPNSTREAQVNGLLAALVENEVWTEVSDEDTVAAYQRYLAAFATGAYAAEAKTRMEHLFEERRQLASRTAEEQPAAPAGACGHPHGDYRVTGIAADDVLWVRRQPRRDASEAGSMPPDGDGIGIGRCVNVPGYSFQWCEVRYRCVDGWAYARYLEEGAASASVESETYRVFGIAADDVLNMREGPGTSYPIVTAIPPNGRGIAVSHCAAAGSGNKWCEVAWQGMNGWASACCLAGEQSGLRPD